MVFEKKENPLSKISQFTDANIGLETLKSLQMFLTPILSTAKFLFICIQYIFLTVAHRKNQIFCELQVIKCNTYHKFTNVYEFDG